MCEFECSVCQQEHSYRMQVKDSKSKTRASFNYRTFGQEFEDLMWLDTQWNICLWCIKGLVACCNFSNSCTHANVSSLEHGFSFNSVSISFTEQESSAIPESRCQAIKQLYSITESKAGVLIGSQTAQKIKFTYGIMPKLLLCHANQVNKHERNTSSLLCSCYESAWFLIIQTMHWYGVLASWVFYNSLLCYV